MFPVSATDHFSATQTRVEDRIAIRFQIGAMETTKADVDIAFEVICDLARKLA